jgi:hypothetical protein
MLNVVEPARFVSRARRAAAGWDDVADCAHPALGVCGGGSVVGARGAADLRRAVSLRCRCVRLQHPRDTTDHARPAAARVPRDRADCGRTGPRQQRAKRARTTTCGRRADTHHGRQRDPEYRRSRGGGRRHHARQRSLLRAWGAVTSCSPSVERRATAKASRTATCTECGSRCREELGIALKRATGCSSTTVVALQLSGSLVRSTDAESTDSAHAERGEIGPAALQSPTIRCNVANQRAAPLDRHLHASGRRSRCTAR